MTENTWIGRSWDVASCMARDRLVREIAGLGLDSRVFTAPKGRGFTVVCLRKTNAS